MSSNAEEHIAKYQLETDLNKSRKMYRNAEAERKQEKIELKKIIKDLHDKLEFVTNAMRVNSASSTNAKMKSVALPLNVCNIVAKYAVSPTFLGRVLDWYYLSGIKKVGILIFKSSNF